MPKGFSEESLGQALVASLFRDYLKRFGEQLQLMRFFLKPHSEIILTDKDRRASRGATADAGSRPRRAADREQLPLGSNLLSAFGRDKQTRKVIGSMEHGGRHWPFRGCRCSGEDVDCRRKTPFANGHETDFHCTKGWKWCTPCQKSKNPKNVALRPILPTTEEVESFAACDDSIGFKCQVSGRSL
jgi:hypothetical protein